jgi:hypothetical protein
VIKHQETHPDLDVEGCFGCKVSAVGFSAELMPTRTGSSRSAVIAQKDRVLDKDLAAYKRLRDDGLQPKNIDGSATVEARANEKWQVETGILPDF